MKLFNKPKHDTKKPVQQASTINNWPDSVVTLDDKNIDEFIQTYPYVIIDFWAPWCAPCRTMGPRLRRLSKIYHGKVVFGKLDIKKHETVGKHYHIQGIPYLLCFRHGKKIVDITGVRSISSLKDTIGKLIKK